MNHYLYLPEYDAFFRGPDHDPSIRAAMGIPMTSDPDTAFPLEKHRAQLIKEWFELSEYDIKLHVVDENFLLVHKVINS